MTDGDAYSASPWPASILLAQQAYVAASRNDTTATARSRSTGNHTVEVTFWIADPPAVSFCTWHCSKDADLKAPPEVVGAQGRFVLLRAVFTSGYYNKDEEEYFVYTGDPRSPSLESIPVPDDHDDRRRLGRVSEFGIVPCGGDGGGHYLLVALRSAEATNFKDYRLHIYSSEERTWRRKEVANPCPGEHAIWPDKVIAVGDGVLAWVSFQEGMVVCDVLHQDQEPLSARHIPLPAPLPENRQDTYLKKLRDVACVGGLIKFVEVEPRVIVTEMREKPLLDPRDKDVLYDSDLIASSKHALIKPKIIHTMNGWSAMTWTRELGSDCWRKGSVVDVDDISVDDAASSALLSGQGNDDPVQRSLPFRTLHSAWPILCVDGNDILYLMSSRHLTHSNEWVVAVDLAKKTLKVEAPREHPFGGCPPWQQICHPCALANHLNMTPGLKVSAINTSKTGSSANEPNNTSICVGEPDSYKSKNKRPRLSPAEKANHAQDGAHSAAQNDLSSQAHSDQNNKPPQLCFNRWAEPGYGGYPSRSWLHQNILSPPPPPPSQCFNGLAGPSRNPMYAPRAPGPDMCSYGNDQPPWQQPLPQEQQTTPSIPFGPHQAPRPSFNNWWGGSYHGSSQQRPAGNSYSYGAPGNANFHPR